MSNIQSKLSSKSLNMDKANKTLPTLVKDILFFYVKYYYDKKLKELNTNQLNNEEVKLFIEEQYVNKKSNLKDYIRKSLKKNQGDNYSVLATENILLEMFSDVEMGKERIKIEILDYQNNHLNNKT